MLSLTRPLAIALIAAGLLAAPAADASSKKFVFVKSRAANVRSTPSVQGQILTTLPFGARLLAQEKVGDWYQVRLADERLGYIHDELVTDEPPMRLFVDVPEAHITTNPTVYGTVKATVTSGTALLAFDKEDDFYLVHAPRRHPRLDLR